MEVVIMKMRLTHGLMVLAMVGLFVACATPDPVITAKVKAQLMADEAVRSTDINVDTKDGVVTVTGTVETQEAKDHAMRLASETRGVKGVVDMISVKVAAQQGDAPEPDRTMGERIDDATITMRVKTQLLDDPAVKGMKIDVDTRDGVVFLTGTARSEAEKDKAIEIARHTQGVRDVQANISVSVS
jgi:osmotically-inducible protein OsmY